MPELARESSFERLKKQASGFPDSPGVYLFKNTHQVVLYVGKALTLKKRVSSYFGSTQQENPKVRALVAQADHLDFVLTEDENQALLLESNFIKKHRPRYNVVLRDDKSYPYLKLTVQEDFPRVFISRRPIQDGAKYYGPYPNLKLREIIKLIYRYFNIRDCNIEIDGKAPRACLSYQIKQCPAPCIGAMDSKSYRPLVKRVQWFLEGKHESLLEHVRGEMLKASQRLEFEEAAKLRDLSMTIEQMQGNYAMIIPEKLDMDVMALALGLGKVLVSVLQVRQGKVIDHVRLILENEMEQPLGEVWPILLEQYYAPGVFVPDEVLVSQEGMQEQKKVIEERLSAYKSSAVTLNHPAGDWRVELMEMAEKNVLSALKEDIQQAHLLGELQQLLGLKNLPRHIACFDISTLQGSFTVGSAVFFRDGVPDKGRYRKFKMKEVQGQDDFRSHQEMMSRYLKLLEREGNPVPDLLLIDGGKGQLSAVQAVLDKGGGNDYGLASLAKREEEVFIPGKSAPVDFRGHLKARHLLQRLRDESHRFAVGYHRVLRDKQAVTSLLSEIKGIGPSRLRSLLNRFESIQAIREAPLVELEAVSGFSKELAHRLYQSFHAL